MQDAYLDHAHPNTAMEQAGLKLGSIASHIESQYYELQMKIKLFGIRSLTLKEKEKLVLFAMFVENKIPSIAAQEGGAEVAKDLRDTFKKTPTITYPESKERTLADAMIRENEREDEEEIKKEPNGKSKPKSNE